MKKLDYELLVQGEKFNECFGAEIEFNEFFMPMHKTMYTPHYHLHYEILYVTENQRLLTVDKKKYILDNNNICFIPPNILHKSTTRNDRPLKRFLINFTNDFIKKYTDILKFDILSCFKSNNYVYNVKNCHQATLKKMMNDIICYSDKSNTFSEQMLALSILKLLTFCSKNLIPYTHAQRITEYLECHYNDDITLESLSKELEINKYKITRSFTKDIGMSLSDKLSHIRIGKAKELLLNTDASVTDIATRIGFQTSSYFSSVFKSITGLSPTQYRNVHKSNTHTKTTVSLYTNIFSDKSYILTDLSNYHIIYVCKNELEIIIDNKKHILCSDSICIIPPNTRVSIPYYKQAQNNVIHIPIPLEFAVMAKKLTGFENIENAENNIVTTLNIKDTNDSLYILDCLAEHIQNNDEYSVQMSVLSFSQLVTLCKKQIYDTNYQNNVVVIYDIINYIDNHYYEDITLDNLQEKFKIGKYDISRKFSIIAGVNFNKYLKKSRIENAKKMLTNHKMKINSIATHTGFRSSSDFARVFKSVTGMTPSQYRKIHLSTDKE